MIEVSWPARTESIKFSFELMHGELADEAKKIFELSYPSEPGDQLRLHYTFFASYVGRLVERFEFLVRLMEAGVVVKANMEELKGQGILFKRLMELYFQITGELDGRSETLPFAQLEGGRPEVVRDVELGLGVALQPRPDRIPGREERNSDVDRPG